MNTWGPKDHIGLGAGHSFTWLVGDPESHPTDDARFLRWRGQDETLVGIIHWHPRPDARPGDLDGGRCGGAVMFVRGESEPERDVWAVHSLEPLHVEPSILCNAAKCGCGSHGWIRDGRWVPA